MPDNAEIIKDVTDQLVEKVAPAVTKEVLEKVESQMKEIKPMFASESEEKKEKAEVAAKYIQSMKSGVSTKDMAGGTAGDGKELVPEYFSDEIITIQDKAGVLRRHADVVDMPGRILHLPTAGSISVSRIDTETTKIPATSPSTGEVVLSLKKLAAIVPVSNDLLRDATPSLVSLIAKLSAPALAKAEDEWGLNGLSAGEGILQNTNVPVLSLDAGKTAFTDAVIENLLGLQDLIADGAIDGSKYLMHRSVLNMFRKEKDNNGQYIWGLNTPKDIWDMAYDTSSVLNATSASGAAKALALLGNLSFVKLGDAKQYSMEISNQATVTSTDGSTLINLFEQDMSAVRIIERIDIQVAEPDQAFAILKTAAS